MAAFNVTLEDNTIRVNVGENTAVAAAFAGQAAASQSAAAASALTASEAATEAGEVLVAVNNAGTTQVAAVNAAGATQIAAVNTAGAGLSRLAETDDLVAIYGANLVSTSANLGSNIGVLQFGLVTGTDLQVGQTLDAIQLGWAAASDATRTEFTFWKRDVAAATSAGTLNNAAPVAQDTLLLTFNTTPAALGITPGTNSPIMSLPVRLPPTVVVETGFDIIVRVRNFNSGGTLVNCGHGFVTLAAGSQRKAGFQAATATPTTFTNLNTARVPAVALFTARRDTRLGALIDGDRLISDGKDAGTLATYNRLNIVNVLANFSVFPVTLANPASFWGDSLTADTAGGVELQYRAVNMVDTVTNGTVNNFGITGETSSQITARVVAATTAQKAGLNQVRQGANDAGGAKTAAEIMTDYATCAAAFTNSNFVFASTWTSGGLQAVSSAARKMMTLEQDLYTTYGAKCLHAGWFFARQSAGSTDAQLNGGLPAGLLVDALHKSRMGSRLEGYDWAAHTIARAGGAPYVHDDMFGVKAGDAVGSTTGTVRTLGNALNLQILAGNEDGAFQINRTTGAIVRTAAPILQPYREMFVGAGSDGGEGRNGRIIIVREMDGTNPQSAVSLAGTGAQTMSPRTDWGVTNGNEMTVVMCARMRPSNAGGAIMMLGNGSSTALLLDRNANGVRINLRSAALASLGSITVNAVNPWDWNWYFFTATTDTGILQGVVNEGSTTSATPTNAALAHTLINTLFSAGTNSHVLMDLKLFAFWTSTIDITSASVRNVFYDPVTRLPRDVGAGNNWGGAVAQPVIGLRGMAGDYLMGRNFGTAGRMLVPAPISRSLVGFRDAEA